MKRQVRGTTYYTVFSLRDGTITAALPTRKPHARIMKREHRRIRDDNICQEYVSSGQELARGDDDRRFRFLDIIATSLNTRRTLRRLVLPELAAIREELASIRELIEQRNEVR